MSRPSLCAVLVFCVTSVASAASAQSSLGVTGFEASAGAIAHNDGGAAFNAGLSMELAVTEHHGLQGNLSWVETSGGAVGRVAGHFYMTPMAGQKYGVFAVVGDVNDRALTYGAAGIEGMFEVSDQTALGGYAGAGIGSHDGLDVIFAGIEATHVFSDTLRVDGGLQITEYDEMGFQAIGTETQINLRYAPSGQRVALTAGIVHDTLSGRDGAPSETRAQLSLSLSIGTINGSEPTTRPFRTPDPILPLVRRGLY